jgi:FAD/FMN-containing dehydrogenase
MWPEFYSQGAKRVGGAAPLPIGSGAYALIEVSASDESAQDQLASLLAAGLEAGVIEDAVLAQSIGQAQNIWSIRDSSGELSKLFDPIGNFDVGLETSRIYDFVTECRKRLEVRWPGVRSYFFGHVVDGNVHLIAGDFTPGDTLAFEEVVYDCVRDFGGSISAEHGIGTQKREHLDYSRSAPEIALMRQMKSSLDPKGILNPGKVFI